MSTAWITEPPIAYGDLKKATLPGLSQHLSDKGDDYAWTDGKNYLWVHEADGNAVYEQMVSSKNKIEGIQRAIAKLFNVEWISEHDEGFWDEEAPDETEEEIQNESGKFEGKLSAMNLLRIAARVASRRYADVPAAPMPQTATPAATKIYRVITDEPQGVAVGFKPSDEALEQLHAEVDEWDLVEDDKSPDAMPMLDLQMGGNNVRILSKGKVPAENWGETLSPLGQDLYIWRSEQEMLDHLGNLD